MRRHGLADHPDHLVPANPIESILAAVRHLADRTGGALSQRTAELPS